ncbi:MAG: MBL fold metallo-hydrolase, partial [candidate division Zixibacteria bacterium]|nr:MBL fold metallo-hydrolase [candidate division Zixibacteria bacterium]
MGLGWLKRGILVLLLAILTNQSYSQLSPELLGEIKSYAPVPASEVEQTLLIPESGYLVKQLKEGIYLLTDGSWQSMFVTTGKGVIVVDAPRSFAPFIQQAIKETTDEPVKYFIYSHSHQDHVSAAHLLSGIPDVKIVAHELTAGLLNRAADPNRPVPTVTFKDRLSIRLGNKVMELEHRGNPHSPGDIFIYLPEQKVLMLVDVIFPGWVPFKNWALSSDLNEYYQAHKEVLTYNFDTFVGGHLSRVGNRKDVEVAMEYFEDVKKYAREAMEMTSFPQVAKQVAEQIGSQDKWA